jgi:hypothetical protein
MLTKNHEIMGLMKKLIVITVRVSFMPRKLLTISLARVRLGRASREAESPSGGHGQSTSSKGFLLSKGNWNKSNERKNTLSLFDTNVRKLYFWGQKVSVPTVSTVSFLIFHLKKVIKSTVCTTEGLGWCNCIFVYQLYLFRSFLYLFC